MYAATEGAKSSKVQAALFGTLSVYLVWVHYVCGTHCSLYFYSFLVSEISKEVGNNFKISYA